MHSPLKVVTGVMIREVGAGLNPYGGVEVEGWGGRVIVSNVLNAGSPEGW